MVKQFMFLIELFFPTDKFVFSTPLTKEEALHQLRAVEDKNFSIKFLQDQKSNREDKIWIWVHPVVIWTRGFFSKN